MVKVSIASPQATTPIDRARMRAAAQAVLGGEGIKEAGISLAFVDNPTIHRLNQRYLQHDEPTDVLSFPSGHMVACRHRFSSSFSSTPPASLNADNAAR